MRKNLQKATPGIKVTTTATTTKKTTSVQIGRSRTAWQKCDWGNNINNNNNKNNTRYVTKRERSYRKKLAESSFVIGAKGRKVFEHFLHESRVINNERPRPLFSQHVIPRPEKAELPVAETGNVTGMKRLLRIRQVRRDGGRIMAVWLRANLGWRSDGRAARRRFLMTQDALVAS